MRRPAVDDWYRHPKYYEAIFGTDTAREMDFVEAVNELYGTGGDVFLEPACGAGRLIAEGAARGRRMIGYDVSPEMLAYARSRLSPRARRRVELSLDRMESFSPPKWQGRVDLAFSLVSTFRYLDSEEAAEAHLRSTHALLAAGGVYVLGFHLTEYSRRHVEHERWVGKVGRETVICNTREWPPDRVRRRSRMRNRLTITAPGAAKPTVIETHWFFRTWDEAQAVSLFDRTGFDVAALYTFDVDVTEPIGWDSNRLDRIFVLAKK